MHCCRQWTRQLLVGPTRSDLAACVRCIRTRREPCHNSKDSTICFANRCHASHADHRDDRIWNVCLGQPLGQFEKPSLAFPSFEQHSLMFLGRHWDQRPRQQVFQEDQPIQMGPQEHCPQPPWAMFPNLGRSSGIETHARRFGEGRNTVWVSQRCEPLNRVFRFGEGSP